MQTIDTCFIKTLYLEIYKVLDINLGKTKILLLLAINLGQVSSNFTPIFSVIYLYLHI
jgi:hypothetical protein